MQKKILIKNGRLWLDNICLVPIISGRVYFADEVKEAFLDKRFDCIAVGLPNSFNDAISEGVRKLPFISVVLAEEIEEAFAYFPIDPCDGMIEAIRLGVKEGVPIHFIDKETRDIPPEGLILPDEYILEETGLSAYIQTVYNAFSAENDEQARFMASKLQDLSFEYRRVLFVFSVHHLPAIVHYYQTEFGNIKNGMKPGMVKLFTAHNDLLFFILGEIPYFTYLYEKLKGIISFDEFKKAEAIKEIFLNAREAFHKAFPEEIYRISLHDLQTALRYTRNLCLIKQRFMPDLYELVVAAKGIGGNDFALKLIEIARFYPYIDINSKNPTIKMTDLFIISPEELKDMLIYRKVPSIARQWRRLKLEKRPTKQQKRFWRTRWNPHTMCSWPPEDEIIENFCGYVRKRALKIAGLSHVRVEEFQSTLKDGIHIRETLRNLHLGKIFVKEEPQIHGEVGAVIFIFDEEDSDEKYPYKNTWQAEHQNESTLVFYATDYREDCAGPDIGRSFYGGALFIFPPQFISDVWKDLRFDDASTNAERLMMAGLYYSQNKYVAVVAKKHPSAFIRDYARLQQRRSIFIPISSFSHKTLQSLRHFHVLNGKHVRSWASQFIA